MELEQFRFFSETLSRELRTKNLAQRAPKIKLARKAAMKRRFFVLLRRYRLFIYFVVGLVIVLTLAYGLLAVYLLNKDKPEQISKPVQAPVVIAPVAPLAVPALKAESENQSSTVPTSGGELSLKLSTELTVISPNTKE
jgi:uncharacterized protein involved in exopolysaccharide biosynthesis